MVIVHHHIIAVVLLILTAGMTFFVDEESAIKDYALEFAAIIWFAIAFPTVQVMIITTYRKLVYSQRDIDDDVSETL